MTEHATTFKKSIMSFKEYLFEDLQEQFSDPENGWGWFIDIEHQEVLTTYQRSFIKHKPFISKFSRIKSMKSCNNLNNIEIKESQSKFVWFVHATCLLTIVTYIIITIK